MDMLSGGRVNFNLIATRWPLRPVPALGLSARSAVEADFGA